MSLQVAHHKLNFPLTPVMKGHCLGPYLAHKGTVSETKVNILGKFCFYLSNGDIFGWGLPEVLGPFLGPKLKGTKTPPK